MERHYGLALEIAGSFKLPHGVDLDDLKQEALMGVARAALKWDPGRKTQFNTYAGSAAKNRCRNYLSDYRNKPISGRATSKEDISPENPSLLDLEPLLHHLGHIPRLILTKFYGIDTQPMKLREIADLTGYSIKQVKTTLSEALETIKLVARPT